MSKRKLIELIKMNPGQAKAVVEGMWGSDFQKTLIQALKDQDRDTRLGCTEAISSIDGKYHDYGYPLPANGVDPWISRNKAYEACLNYQDKDLEGM